MGIWIWSNHYENNLLNISKRYCILFPSRCGSLELFLIAFILLKRNTLLMLYSLYIESLFYLESLFYFHFVSRPKGCMKLFNLNAYREKYFWGHRCLGTHAARAVSKQVWIWNLARKNMLVFFTKIELFF